jgi:hypothetical protein
MKFLTKLTVIYLILSGLCRGVFASNSAGVDVTEGVGTSGFELNGSLDLKPEGIKNPIEASVAYAHQHTTVGTESRTNQYTAGLDHDLDNNWNYHGQVTYWDDSLNEIHYAGPTLGFTYTWNENDHPAKAKSEESETETEPASENEMAALSVNADLFFYGTEVVASSTTRRVRNPITHQLQSVVIGPADRSIHLTQFHPSATLEKPFGDSVTPYLTAGHYFYSKDPASIEALAGRPRLAASVNQINGLVAGFSNNNVEVGVRWALPWRVNSNFRLGAVQETTDNHWATTQGVTLTRTFIDHLKIKLDWSRSIQDGVSDDLFTTGLTWQF